MEKLKWIEVLDLEKDSMGFLLAKGYNHFNEQQSKMGKPNLHFKVTDLKKKNRIG